MKIINCYHCGVQDPQGRENIKIGKQGNKVWWKYVCRSCKDKGLDTKKLLACRDCFKTEKYIIRARLNPYNWSERIVICKECWGDRVANS
mgnify:CR=1 FL=1